MECLRLRVKDVEFARNLIVVREGKGGKDRRVPLPIVVRQDVVWLARVKRIHEQELSEGVGSVYLPDALARKCPMASVQWAWQWLFPAADHSTDPRTGIIRRHHLQDWNIQRPVAQAIRDLGIKKNPRAVIALDIPLRPTCWKMDTIYGPFRSCSATAT